MGHLQPTPEMQPFILASHDCLCRWDREWDLSGRKGSWSLWTVIDARVRWRPALKEDAKPLSDQWFTPGQALLRWEGVAGTLLLPKGCRLHGVEFDVRTRERRTGQQYGWHPVQGTGAAHQPTPEYFFGARPANLFGGSLAASAERLLARVAIRWWRNTQHDQLSCNLQLAGWLAELADSIAVGGEGPIDRAEVFARHSLHSDCSVEAMARVAGMPTSTFCERYQAERSETPGMFLRRLRFELAASILVSQNVSIEAICHRCGYQNAASFSRSFKKHFGKSPRQYREEHRRGTGSPAL